VSEKQYPEIEALQKLADNFEIEIVIQSGQYLAGNENYPAAKFTTKDQSFELFLYDEYEDLKWNNPLLHLCLALMELENYDDAEDYLQWCTFRGLEAANEEMRSYHTGLGETYNALKNILGEIDPQVSYFDFELNAGAAQALRKGNTSIL
jgi:hypothetical protein